MLKLSPLPWRTDVCLSENKDSDAIHVKVVDANGMTILDTYNSDVICIECESDGDSGISSYWDAQGETNLNKVSQVMNAFGTIKDPAKFIETFDAMAKEFLSMKELIGEPRNALMQMIDKAIFYREEK